MLWTDPFPGLALWGQSFSSATAPPSGWSCGVILYIIPETFPPEHVVFVGGDRFSRSLLVWRLPWLEVLQCWLVCRDGSPSRGDDKDLEANWLLKNFSIVTAVCRAITCLYLKMFSFHKVWWKINISIFQLKMFTGELGICSFITRTKFTFLALAIIKLACFTFKKNSVPLWNYFLLLFPPQSFPCSTKSESSGSHSTSYRITRMVVSCKDSREMELNQQLLICWFNWVQTS